jgi:S-methyl-5-thioribose-1-phosphate isomerase
MKSLQWNKGKVRFLDQTRLPSDVIYIETDDEGKIANAIRNLSIRGAPLIGIAAAYAVALAANKCGEETPSGIASYFDKVINLLAGTRPTAINLFWALNRQKNVVEANKRQGLNAVRTALLQEALEIHEEDAAMCEAIGNLGADLLPNAASVLTHCNTGMLATGGIGTALGIIRKCWEQQRLKHVYIDETRPLFQGGRLTAWELRNDRIPFTLLTDNVAGFLMQQRIVNAVVVGADRIALNGDVANKVGTYSLAVLARYHDIPMYVAAPTSTIDFDMKNGKGIPIEQRNPKEVTEPFGKKVTPDDTDVYSPAFDITPCDLVSAIVTEKGVLSKPYEQSIRRIRGMASS